MEIFYNWRLSCILMLLTGSLTALQAQNKVTVSGKVSWENNEPAPGVSVLVKGTSSGTTTPADGAYSVAVPGSSGTLIFSFIGYASQEMTIGKNHSSGKTTPDAKALAE